MGPAGQGMVRDRQPSHWPAGLLCGWAPSFPTLAQHCSILLGPWHQGKMLEDDGTSLLLPGRDVGGVGDCQFFGLQTAFFPPVV